MRKKCWNRTFYNMWNHSKRLEKTNVVPNVDGVRNLPETRHKLQRYFALFHTK